MESWADSDSNLNHYNPLPVPADSDLRGSRAAALDSKGLFSCGGFTAKHDCFTTTVGQPDWKPAPSLNVSIEIIS